MTPDEKKAHWIFKNLRKELGGSDTPDPWNVSFIGVESLLVIWWETEKC